MIQVPTPSEVDSSVLWMWHDDGTGPAVFRARVDLRAWEGQISLLDFDWQMQDGWNFCGGCRMTLLPVDQRCPELDRIYWPVWLEDAWCELIGHSKR